MHLHTCNNKKEIPFARAEKMNILGDICWNYFHLPYCEVLGNRFFQNILYRFYSFFLSKDLFSDRTFTYLSTLNISNKFLRDLLLVFLNFFNLSHNFRKVYYFIIEINVIDKFWLNFILPTIGLDLGEVLWKTIIIIFLSKNRPYNLPPLEMVYDLWQY